MIAEYTENIARDTPIDQRCIRTGEWKLILTRPVRGLRKYTGDPLGSDLADLCLLEMQKRLAAS